jgi:hypothetical protein
MVAGPNFFPVLAVPPGAPGQILTALGDGTSQWSSSGLGGTGQACRVFSSSPQNVPDNGFVAVIFESERFDTDNMFDISNPTRITFNTPGFYLVGGTLEFEPNATASGPRNLSITLNGTTAINSGETFHGPNFPYPEADLETNTVYLFQAGDYIELTAFQHSVGGETLVIQPAGDYSPEFYAIRLGPAPVPVAPPACRVYNSSTIPVSSGFTGVVVPFDTERYDTDNMHSNVNPTRITFNTPGFYLVGLQAIYADNPTGLRGAYMLVNGSVTVDAGQQFTSAAMGGPAFLQSQAVQLVAAGDYLEMITYQTSGGSLNLTADAVEMYVIWMGPSPV